MSKCLKSTDGNYIELTGTIKAKTEKALLFNDGVGKEVWLPLSQINSQIKGVVTIIIPEWLAIDKELV